MTSSLVPAAVSALHALHAANLPSGFPLSIGEPPGGDIPSRYAAVAYGGEDRPGIMGQGEPGGPGNPTERAAERFGVWCTLSVASGDTNAAAALADVNALWQPVANALRADRSLGGTVVPPGVASLAAYEWSVEQGGQVVTVFYLVEVVVLWLT